MTIVVVDEPEDNGASTEAVEEAVEALTETVETLAETVEELATENTESESSNDSLSDIVLGTVVARLEALENEVATLRVTADVALSVADEALQEAVTEPVIVDDEPGTSEPEPDTPPATWRTRLHSFWYGDS